MNFAVARYNPNGTLDDGFGQDGLVRTDVGGGVYDAACCVAVDSQQRILVGGNRAAIPHQHVETPDVFAVARYLSDGTLDTSFGTQGIVTTDVGSGSDLLASDLALGAADGFVLAGGTNSSFAAVRYDSTGTLRTGFGTNGRVVTSNPDGSAASSVAIQSDGRVVLAGGYGHIFVVRYQA